ncbi:hypothetical protein I4F81_005191 [Pyropia yezoensis]|uniref:Uncharacterized protein n=1 Tax=Pyropia yezoensis TaxID=2788 RepID=A0ACC3BYH3_PYRYE|nr:hypothetical protein I4F81_005191 [Neopyropia yezoensis]
MAASPAVSTKSPCHRRRRVSSSPGEKTCHRGKNHSRPLRVCRAARGSQWERLPANAGSVPPASTLPPTRPPAPPLKEADVGDAAPPPHRHRPRRAVLRERHIEERPSRHPLVARHGQQQRRGGRRRHPRLSPHRLDAAATPTTFLGGEWGRGGGGHLKRAHPACNPPARRLDHRLLARPRRHRRTPAAAGRVGLCHRPTAAAAAAAAASVGVGIGVGGGRGGERRPLGGGKDAAEEAVRDGAVGQLHVHPNGQPATTTPTATAAGRARHVRTRNGHQPKARCVRNAKCELPFAPPLPLRLPPSARRQQHRLPPRRHAQRHLRGRQAEVPPQDPPQHGAGDQVRCPRRWMGEPRHGAGHLGGRQPGGGWRRGGGRQPRQPQVEGARGEVQVGGGRDPGAARRRHR